MSSGKWQGRHINDPNTCPICGGPRNTTSGLIVTDDAVYWQGAEIHFSHKERLYIEQLVRNLNKVVTKESMYTRLYAHLPDCDWPQEKIVDVYICKIRRRLQAAGIPVVIETFWGRGWLLREIKHEPTELRDSQRQADSAERP